MRRRRDVLRREPAAPRGDADAARMRVPPRAVRRSAARGAHHCAAPRRESARPRDGGTSRVEEEIAVCKLVLKSFKKALPSFRV
jgi:hypothetical protein